MYGKVVLSFFFVLLLITSYAIFVGNLDIQSYFSPLLNSTSTVVALASSPCPASNPPLQIYMYDLHRRFNVGMLDRNSSVETPVTVQDWPPYPKNSGLRKQHSVEYWMMGSLMLEGYIEYAEAVRVSDPEIADAFFVPFFSSLSNNLHGHQSKGPAVEVDHQLQVYCRPKFVNVLLLFLEKSELQ